MTVIGLFRSRASLQVEILTLRHQLNVLRRKSPQRLTFSSIDRLVFDGLYRLVPGVLDALKIVRPETVIRWHRAGFRAYWRWKSTLRGGRPTDTAGNSSADPRDQHRQPVVGRAESMESFSSSASSRPDHRRQVYGAGRGPASAGMEDVPSQPCRLALRNGPLRRADDLVPAALWVADHGITAAAKSCGFG